MGEMIKMIVVLTVLAALSGGLLAAIRDNTAAQIEIQELQFVKGPAIEKVMKGAENDPIADRFKLTDGETERSFFIGKFDGKANVVAFESFGPGYADDVGVMAAINLDEDVLVDIGITKSLETPGLGARAKEDPAFAAQFQGLSVLEPFAVSQDDGKISALSGATITSRAVCTATTNIGEIYQRLKPQIEEKIQSIQ